MFKPIITRDPVLSSYNLACGYVQHARSGYADTELYREHGVYHVRTHVITFPPEWQGSRDVRKAWHTFHNLKDARKDYVTQIRAFHTV